MSVTHLSEVIFLGLCDRAKYVPDLQQWNVLGLGRTIRSHIFPLSLDNFVIGLTVFGPSFQGPYHFQIVDKADHVIGELYLDACMQVSTLECKEEENDYTILVHKNGWSNVFLPLSQGTAVINTPGAYRFRLIKSECSIEMGEVQFSYVRAPSLTQERKQAILSGPCASQAVTLELGCKDCSSTYRIYTALEKKLEFEAKGWHWYEDVPETFMCQCGQTHIDLQYIKHNLHCYLGQEIQGTSHINPISMYETTGLKKIYNRFSKLLDDDPKEEKLQKFIEKNPVLLHQFPAEKIIHKPPILSSFIADFAIVTSQKELILIEIEKTTTKLMKKSGNRAAELTHAFDQVRSWLSVFVEHRTAVLDDLCIQREEVSAIKGVVIAGREKGYDAQKLRSLKMHHEGPIAFLTFDDLLYALGSLIRRFESM